MIGRNFALPSLGTAIQGLPFQAILSPDLADFPLARV
jgi:hypothetical protein